MQLELYYRLHYRFPSKKGSGGGFIKVTIFQHKLKQLNKNTAVKCVDGEKLSGEEGVKTPAQFKIISEKSREHVGDNRLGLIFALVSFAFEWVGANCSRGRKERNMYKAAGN